MTLRFAYNTNGAANHRLEDAVALIADAGYDGVALTLDHHHLDPLADGWVERAEALARELHARRLSCVIETGARFLLDPRAKHEPTLAHAERGRACPPRCVPQPGDRRRRASLARRQSRSGPACRKPGVDRGEAGAWLVEGIAAVLDHAAKRGVTAALEPEPGMLVETLDDWLLLRRHLPGLKLALDLGHCLVTGERAPPAAVAEFAADLGTVAIEDMRRGEHVHLPFGEGDMDIPACLDALEHIGFPGLVCVELSRESHRADTMIPQSLDVAAPLPRGAANQCGSCFVSRRFFPAICGHERICGKPAATASRRRPRCHHGQPVSRLIRGHARLRRWAAAEVAGVRVIGRRSLGEADGRRTSSAMSMTSSRPSSWNTAAPRSTCCTRSMAIPTVGQYCLRRAGSECPSSSPFKVATAIGSGLVARRTAWPC